MTISDSRTLQRVPRIIVAAGDISLVLGGIYLAFYTRYLGDIPSFNYSAFVELVPWLIGLSLLIFAGLDLYSSELNGFLSTARALTTGIILLAVTTATASYWFREFSFPRTVIVLSAVFQLLLLLTWRWAVWHLDYRLHGQKRLLVLGSEAEAGGFGGKLHEMPRGAFKIVHRLAPEAVDKIRSHLADVDGLVILPSVSPKTRLKAVASASELNKDIYLVPGVYEVMLSSARVSQIDDLPVLRFEGFQVPWMMSFTKRAIDVFVSTTGLLLTLPVIAVFGIFIRMTSPGPVFYVQERVGQNGRVFKLYKLRTMVVDAEKETGPVLATADDPRVTRIGRFLRATRLDELPQLVNVLKGDMSIVGPRPERPEFVKQFNKKNPAYRHRHIVKPGLTGWAQVNGRYDTSAEDKLRFDLYYIRNYSVIFDLQIILRTIPVMFTPSSAQSKKVNSVEKMCQQYRQL